MPFYLILGLTYGFAAAIQPGPLLTYLISRTLTVGWRRTLPAVFSPLITDGPIALLTLAVLSAVPESLLLWLRFLGGAFLIYLAREAWRGWRRFDVAKEAPVSAAGQGVLRAALVNLLNPNPYLGWSLVLGPLLLKGWKEAPAGAVALVAGFYAAMIGTMVGSILLFQAAGRIGPRVNRALIGLSAVALGCFGIYQLTLAAVTF